MTIELAHITDPHLPLVATRPRELLGKRILGWLSWTLRRRRMHRPEVLAAVLDDIRKKAPRAHLVITGDLVNISTHGEFAAARAWLEGLESFSGTTLVPGNHDYYVAAAGRIAGDTLAPWMANADIRDATAFPFVRQVGDVALIGLNSAYAAPWREASGRLGERQLQRLERILRDCGQRGLCRVVLVHHPPLPALNANPRKALKDAPALAQVLAEAGAELVLFGHTHRWTRHEMPIADPAGRDTRLMHVLSAPSASMAAGHKAPPAGWQHIRISRTRETWRIDVARYEVGLKEGLGKREAFTLLCSP